jgi:hypothetical protein
MSRTSNDDADVKINKLKKKKKKKKMRRDDTEGNPFMARLESIKKELGMKQITSEQFWMMQRNVSKFYNFTILELHSTLFRFQKYCC